MNRSRLTQSSKYALLQTKVNENMVSERKVHCTGCENWSHKMKELTWSYEQLIQSKDDQIKNLHKVIQQLDIQNAAISKKLQASQGRLQQVQAEFQNQRYKFTEQQSVIQYFKERQVELLTQLKQTQNELYMKSVQVRDDKDEKEEKLIQKVSEIAKTQSKLKQNNELLPVLHYQINQSQSLNKMLNKNIVELQKVKQDKLILQVKHRMALLRAVQFSVLK